MKPKKYASFLDRLAAFGLDWFILAIITAAATSLVGFEYTNPDNFQQFKLTQMLPQVAGIIVGWIYYAGMESSELQATIGKQVMNLKVTDLDEKRVSFLKATARHFSKILSVLSLGVGFLMIIFTEKKQALHDMVANCVILNE
ncbi:MAG: RDD family protein [Candidatus Magasanikbacteria bacterium]